MCGGVPYQIHWICQFRSIHSQPPVRGIFLRRGGRRVTRNESNNSARSAACTESCAAAQPSTERTCSLRDRYSRYIVKIVKIAIFLARSPIHSRRFGEPTNYGPFIKNVFQRTVCRSSAAPSIRDVCVCVCEFVVGAIR